MKPIMYEAVLYSVNGAEAFFEFEADNAKLAKDHAETLANSGTWGYEWNKKPNYMKCIDFRKKGLSRFKRVKTTRYPIN